MNEQTEDYIKLKSISERFKNVANSISDEDINCLIKNELREQIAEKVNLGTYVEDIVIDYMEDPENVQIIHDAIKKEIKNALK